MENILPPNFQYFKLKLYLNTGMTRRKKPPKITYLKEDPLFVHFSFILHFRHLMCFLMNALYQGDEF